MNSGFRSLLQHHFFPEMPVQTCRRHFPSEKKKRIDSGSFGAFSQESEGHARSTRTREHVLGWCAVERASGFNLLSMTSHRPRDLHHPTNNDPSPRTLKFVKRVRRRSSIAVIRSSLISTSNPTVCHLTVFTMNLSRFVLKSKPFQQPVRIAMRGLADVHVEHGRAQWATYGDIENYKQGKYQVKTFNKISNVGLSQFPSDEYDIRGQDKEAANAHAILLRSHKLQEEEVPQTVRAIARYVQMNCWLKLVASVPIQILMMPFYFSTFLLADVEPEPTTFLLPV